MVDIDERDRQGISIRQDLQARTCAASTAAHATWREVLPRFTLMVIRFVPAYPTLASSVMLRPSIGETDVSGIDALENE